jgi:hypothetical protein
MSTIVSTKKRKATDDQPPKSTSTPPSASADGASHDTTMGDDGVKKAKRVHAPRRRPAKDPSIPKKAPPLPRIDPNTGLPLKKKRIR